MLAADHPHHADTQRRIRVVNRQIDFIVGTVKRLLEWTHRKQVSLRPVDINKLVREVLWLVSPTLDRNAIAVELTLAEGLPPVRADRDSLQQVFLNLINNSADAMSGGGRIEITTRLDESAGVAEIVVRDTGVGVRPEAAEHLFEPMWTSKPTGSGFGLAIAREIMTDHGGEIALVEGVARGVSSNAAGRTGGSAGGLQ